MGSLTDLNTFAQTTVEYSDARDPNIIIDPPTATDPDQTLQGQQFDIVTPINVVEVIAYEDCDPTYIIEVPVVGATLAWDDFPAECTVVQDGFIWTVTGMQDADQWYRIKSPTVTVPAYFQGSLSYEVTLRWTTLTGVESQNWTVGVYIPVVSMSATTAMAVDALKVKGVGLIPIESTTQITATANISIIDFLVPGATADFDYSPGVATALGSSAPQLSGIGQGLTEYTVEVTTPDVVTFDSFTMIDGASYNFSYDPVTKTATFSGDATELDTALQNLQPIFSDDPIHYYIYSQLDFSMTNSLDAAVDTFTLPLKSTDTTHLTVPTLESYTINTPATITGAPKIPSAVTEEGVYAMIIEPNDPAQVTSLTGEVITGVGLDAGTRLYTTAVGTQNFSGQQVAISETGSYIALAGRNNHRIYYDSGSGYTLQKTYDDSSYLNGFETGIRNDAFAMSTDGVYLAFKTRGSTQDTVYIETRSGTTWSNQHSFTVSGGGSVESLRFNKTGTKLAVATDDGNFEVYTRSGSTWSSSFSVTTGFSDFGAFDMDPSGTRYAISEEPVFSGDTTVKIYNGSTLEHEFEMTSRVDIFEYPESGAEPTSLAFDDGANTLVVMSEYRGITILERSGTTWSRNVTLAAYDDGAGADQSFYPRCDINWAGDTIVVSGHRYDYAQSRYEAYLDIYLKNDSNVWSFSIRGQNSLDRTDAAFYSMPAFITGDGTRAGYGLPDTSGISNYGSATIYTSTPYGRFETGTKELTVIGDKASFNAAVDGFVMTPATDESDTINLNYGITYPQGDVAVRNQKVE